MREGIGECHSSWFCLTASYAAWCMDYHNVKGVAISCQAFYIKDVARRMVAEVAFHSYTLCVKWFEGESSVDECNINAALIS